MLCLALPLTEARLASHALKAKTQNQLQGLQDFGSRDLGRSTLAILKENWRLTSTPALPLATVQHLNQERVAIGYYVI